MARILSTAHAIGRLAGRGANNSRVLRAGSQAAQAMLRSTGRVVHVIWLQITGLFFLLFAVSFALRIPGTYARYTAGQTPRSHVVLLVCFSLLFGWFGVSSFWRAKKKKPTFANKPTSGDIRPM